MTTPSIEVVVTRDGREVMRRRLSGVWPHAPIPERGYEMADMAETTAIRRNYAEILANKAHSARDIASRWAGEGKNVAGKSWGWLQGTGVYVRFRGVLAGTMSFLGRQASKLGRIGTISLVVTSVTSDRGQRIIGGTLGLAARIVDGTVSAVINTIDWVPFIGPPVARSIAKARQWVKDRALDAKLFSDHTRFGHALRRDGVITRKVRSAAKLVLPYELVHAFVPGWWKVPAYLVLFCWYAYKAMTSRTVGAAVSKAYAGLTREVEEIKEELRETVATEQQTSVAKLAEEIFETEQVTETPAAPTLADQKAHEAAAAELDQQVMEHRSNNYQTGRTLAEAAQIQKKRQRRDTDLGVIVTATVDFFGEKNADTKYATQGACIASLKQLVSPRFKATMAREKGNRAAQEFSEEIVKWYSEGSNDGLDASEELMHVELTAARAFHRNSPLPALSEEEEQKLSQPVSEVTGLAQPVLL